MHCHYIYPVTHCYPLSFPLNPSFFPPILLEIMTTPLVAIIKSHRLLMDFSLSRMEIGPLLVRCAQLLCAHGYNGNAIFGWQCFISFSPIPQLLEYFSASFVVEMLSVSCLKVLKTCQKKTGKKEVCFN